MDLQTVRSRRAGGELPGRVAGADRSCMQDRAVARGAHARHRTAARGDPRLHRVRSLPVPDSHAHPRAGGERARGDDGGARRHAVPKVGTAAQPVLRRTQGEPAGTGTARVRRVDHRAAPRSDPDARRDAGGRQRSRARRHDQGGAARGVEPRPGMGLPPRPRHPPAPAVCARFHVDRLRSLHAGNTTRRAGARGRWWWESDTHKECLLHPPLEVTGAPEPVGVPVRHGAV